MNIVVYQNERCFEKKKIKLKKQKVLATFF